MKKSARVVIDRKGTSGIVQYSESDNSHISEFDYDLGASQQKSGYSEESCPYSDAGLQVCKIVLYPFKKRLVTGG